MHADNEKSVHLYYPYLGHKGSGHKLLYTLSKLLMLESRQALVTARVLVCMQGTKENESPIQQDT